MHHLVLPLFLFYGSVFLDYVRLDFKIQNGLVGYL